MAIDIPCLLERINCDIVAADFRWSLFYAALNSYRHDTVLRPYPSFLTKEENGEKDFDHVQLIAKEIKNLKDIGQTKALTPESCALLDWVLDVGNFTLKTHPVSKFSDIEKMTGQIVKTASPNFIFEVVYESPAEARFASFRNEYEVTYAYHGSRFENFHSILHNGLCNHMNKNSVFGKGTYLSSELGVCMVYSPIGQGWNQSEMGDKLSCIAVCEVIVHPDVKSQTKESKTGSWISSNSVPEKYFIVQNDELVRVKFLLVYSENPRPKCSKNKMTSLRSWIFQNRFWLMMVTYVIILVSIGFINSRPFQAFYRNHISYF